MNKIIELIHKNNFDEIYLMTDFNLINEKDENGKTPLIHASILGDITLVKFLLANGADKNILDNDNKNASHHAANNLHPNLLIYLIDGGFGG